MKPLCLCSKGEANAQAPYITTDMLGEHYRQVAAGLYKWTGLPEGCPPDYIEGSALFFRNGISAKKIKGYGIAVMPIAPKYLDIYGRPYEWMPSLLDGFLPPQGMGFMDPSKNPSLWIGHSTYQLIEPYLQLMGKAVKCLGQNISAMATPVMIAGQPGNDLQGIILNDELMIGEIYLPYISKTQGLGIDVLDLKATDHTQNLVSTIDWCDSRILEAMASSNGVEKASGITTMETVSGVQSVVQQVDSGLESRKAWCEGINDALGLSIAVDKGEGMSKLEGEGSPVQQEDEDDEKQ